MSKLAELDELLTRTARLYRRPQLRESLVAAVPGIGSAVNLQILRAVETRLRSGERPAVGDIAYDLVIEASTASRAVQAAVERGLLEKSPSDSDQRKSLLNITPRGWEVLEQAGNYRLAVLRSAVGDWPGGDIDLLVGLLDRLVRRYEERGTGSA